VSDGLVDVEIRPAGDRAFLLVLGAGRRNPRALDQVVDRLRAMTVRGMQDFLPAAETVLVTLEAEADPAAVEEGLRRLLAQLAPEHDRAEGRVTDAADVTIPVRYDGVDLAEVATLLGTSPEEVVARHTGRVWRCRFLGFTAGFGYLESEPDDLVVPRRQQSRTAIPAGSVALADGYSAVYPRRGPGGWQLIGTTSAPMWDLDRDPPALLSPGSTVRFVQDESS
jgi:KipI family sensor histidine kinase inhibitor